MKAMGAEEDGTVIGYMCTTDWECEMGLASPGNLIYPTIEDLKLRSKCWKGCGIVEVKVAFSKVVFTPAPEEIPLAMVVDSVIKKWPERVNQIKVRPTNLGWLVGQVMKESNGAHEASKVSKLLKKKLGINEILGFKGQYRWLSNFPSHPIEWDGVVYPSPENAYQAAKTLDPEERKQFLACTSAEAKRLGTKVTLRADWEDIKIEVMTEIQRRKYRNLALRLKLIRTDDAYIEETNTWGDKFWGVCKGEGLNVLGKAIMKVRDEIKSQPAADGGCYCLGAFNDDFGKCKKCDDQGFVELMGA